MFIANISSAIFMFLIGFLIKKFKLAFLISGYNTASKEERDKYDKNKLTKVMGNMLMISALLLITPFISLIFKNELNELAIFISWIAFSAYVIGFVIYINVNSSVVKK